MRKVLVVGSTGSIGKQALELIAASDELELVGLAAATGWREVAEQVSQHDVERVAMADSKAATRLKEAIDEADVLAGNEGIVELITASDADLVLNAVVGSAGLGPTLATLGEGIDLALANKESLVVAGDLVTKLAEATDARIIPVDSEHSALFQLIGSESPGHVERIVLTASGGPFRGRSRSELEQVTREEALSHPTWSMGAKITIDSATLMNKGLELIEAHHLFGTPYERMGVVIHPQSMVHAMVHLNDGSSLAHLGYPDMRVPISYALHYPEREDVPVPTLDLADVGALSFEEPDTETFECLDLARRAAYEGGTSPCVMNAANEVATAAFLDGRIGFLDIAKVIEATLDSLPAAPVHEFEDLYAMDREARRVAEETLNRLGSEQPL